MRSLRARVMAFTLIVISAVLVPLGILSYHKTVEEFDELGDARLVQSTRTIDVLAEHAGLRKPSTGAPLDVLIWRSPFRERTVSARGHAYEIRLGFQFWSPDHRLKLASDNFQSVALAATPSGFADLVLQDGRWRIFTMYDPDGDVIRVAERYDSRNGIARDLLWEHLIPMLVALPVIALLVGLAVHRALRPLDSLTRDLGTRLPDDITPITLPGVPRELAPVLASLNGLVNRVHTALDRERHFAADAAHQLRTPLAAALLHLENATATESPDLRTIALRRAQEGLGRLQHLVNQFLDLAHWETVEREPERELVDLEACVRTEVEDAAMLAAEKDLEVSIMIQDAPARICGWETAIRALVRNLIDNAFKYTPARGRVDVRVYTDKRGTLLEVNDSGPGIPLEQRTTVFERFRRGHSADIHGSGLGLSIVGRIAHLHDAAVEFGASRFGSGLCIRAVFPAANSPSVEQIDEVTRRSAVHVEQLS